MRIFRLFTGPDQQSHIEEIKFDFKPVPNGVQGPTQNAKGVYFARSEPGAFIDWHPAPRRQYVITLSGAVEIGLGDGTFHRFGPGEGLLAEDLTGQGHTTRSVGPEPRCTMVVPLAD